MITNEVAKKKNWTESRHQHDNYHIEEDDDKTSCCYG